MQLWVGQTARRQTLHINRDRKAIITQEAIHNSRR